MNKKIIAIAIAAIVAAPAAMAETTVYGKAHVSIDQIDSDGSGTDNIQVSDRGSRLGFKGSEDLGNGMKAVFKYELVYDIDEGAGFTGTSRNSYIGLAGDFGTFLVGRHDTPAKVAFYGTGAELLGDSVIQFTGSGDGALLNMRETRADDAIAYITPSMSGLTAAVAIVPGEGTSAAGNDGIADAWSAAVMYKGHGLKAAFGYEDLEDLGGTNTGFTNWNAGASYTMGSFTVGGVYQMQEAAVGGAESEMLGLTGQAKFGNNAIIASYGMTENNVAGQEGDGFGIAMTHSMSKRTKVYAAYASKDVDTGNSVTSLSGGVFNQGDAFSLGMFHSF